MNPPVTPGQLAGALKRYTKTSRIYREQQDFAARQRKRRLVQYMLKRHGADCFYCGKPMGDDTTIEHLLERSQGGTNDHANLRLAHERCNQRVAGLSVMDKLDIRARMLTAKQRGA